jgi:glycosyltransferase involved in cell wall biosynthesis
MRGRRILLVTNWLGWAGAERQLEHLAIGLAENGAEVVLLAIGDRKIEDTALVEAGVRVVDLGAIGKFEKLRALPRLIRFARAAEVVHCTGWDATMWGRIAAFLARRPVVITEHTPGRDSQLAGGEGTSDVRLIALHNRILDHVTYATIVVGAWQRELLIGEGVRANSLVHVPNGVPIAALRARAGGVSRASIGVPEGAPVLVQVARFAPQKGQAVALRAVARLRERHGDVRLVFVGGEGNEAELKETAAAMGADWAHFVGFREDVPALLALADLSILPSEAEGLPMALIEAIAVGTPIVATDVGDIAWFLETSGAGICVPAGDEEAFTVACGEVLGDPELRERLAQAARDGSTEFDAAKMVRRYEAVLEAAVEDRPLPVELPE